jgi:hypothetical protein|tara:strand:- start:1413 stop:1625 length:213 start_codon:yes stop_codon:yes gene_type:complete
MKRLTLHLKHAHPRVEKRTVKGQTMDKTIIRNTLSFEVDNNDEATKIVSDINDNAKPRNNVKKWYLSNIM